MSDVVMYNYSAMDAVATQIQHAVQIQQALLDSGVANKQAMLAQHHGDSADTFEMCHQKFEQVCHSIIEIGSRGVMAYRNGTEGMAHAEKLSMNAFPG